jgi:8-oxo-dGTP diphosphatase
VAEGVERARVAEAPLVDVTSPGGLVRAAGGLVRRPGENGRPEIVLVHRPAYDDWAFPKGKLRGNETEEEAAVREVEEETGLRCTLGREVGVTSYRDAQGRPKTVHYWEMLPVAGVLAPANEVDDARWVPLAEAPAALTYARDRELLARLAALG